MDKLKVADLLKLMRSQFPSSRIEPTKENVDAWHSALASLHEKAVFEAYEHFLGLGDTFPPTAGQIVARAKNDAPAAAQYLSKIMAPIDGMRPTQTYMLEGVEDGHKHMIYTCRRTKHGRGDRTREQGTGLTRVYLD